MQRLDSLRWLSLPLLVVIFFWSEGRSTRRFISLHQPLVIKAQKNSPPHIAFEALLSSESTDSEWSSIKEKSSVMMLATTLVGSQPKGSPVRLQEMVIAKTVGPIAIPTQSRTQQREATVLPEQIHQAIEAAQTEAEPADWVQSLSSLQRKRIELAQERNEILDQNWQADSLGSAAQKLLEQASAPAVRAREKPNSGAVMTQTKKESLPSQDQNKIRQDSSVAKADLGTGESEMSFMSLSEQPDQLVISGPIEISGGLAITNEHHIEVRRSNEGVVKESGRVDLQKGIYKIDVEDPSGLVIAQLIDQEGRILGEGSVRLNQVVKDGAEYIGPKLKLTPQISFVARIQSIYGEEAALPADTRATLIKGAGEDLVSKQKTVTMNNAAKNSSTVLRVAGKDYLQTSQIICSGTETKAQLFSEKFMTALKDHIYEYKQLTAASGAQVIWGRALLDGKPQAGVQVILESDQSLEAVYLDEYLVPQFDLKSTGPSGYYVFMDVRPGFHTLRAAVGDNFFGYQNAEVEEGTVALAPIEATTKKEIVPLRVYDAFSGDPKKAQVTLQSLADELTVDQSGHSIQLPRVSRLGLMQVQPESVDYVPARYIYSDNDAYIHAPLIQWSWISNIRVYKKYDDQPSTGAIVGFVPDENFEVYLAGYDSFDPRNIVYFDMQGKIIESAQKGVAGGGFILFNVSEDTHEVVVIGQRSQKIISRVLPVDVGSLSVLSFR